MDDALRERVEALERAVTDGEHDLSAFADEAAALDRLATLESEVEDLADRVEELEAATQALRGYVGNVRSINSDVEQRADAALAKVEALERSLPAAATADRQPGTAAESVADVSDGAVDDWEWGTNSDGTDTAGQTNSRAEDANGSVDAHEDDLRGGNDEGSGRHSTGTDSLTSGGEPGTQPTPAGATTGQPAAPEAGEGPGGDGNGGPPPERLTTGTQSSSGIAVNRHAEANHRADGQRDADERGHDAPYQQGNTHYQGDSHPHSGASGDTTSRDAHRCASCGRPQSTTPATGAPAGTADRATASGTAETGDWTADASAASTGTEPSDTGRVGAPTVAAIAEGDPDDAAVDSPSEDGDILPDGADDPLVGEEDGDAGTLQRIRDLL